MLETVLIGGGTVTPQANTGSADPRGVVAVDAKYVYWTNAGALYVEPKGGGPTSAYLVTAAKYANLVAVDATNLYWTDGSGSLVVKLAIGGGPPFLGTPSILASGVGAVAIALDATSIYLGVEDTFNTGRVLKMSIDGGTPLTLASGGVPRAIAVDATSVYWTTDANYGTLQKVPK